MNMKQRECLIIVDMQYDFLPGGALGIEGSDQMINYIVNQAMITKGRGGIVIATRDYHPPDHISFDEYPEYKDRSWPVHCVQGTKGVKIHPKIRKVADFIVSKGYDAEYEAYSAFAGTTLKPKLTLEELLKEQAITQVVVVGLALDYCVMYTALDANALGYETSVDWGGVMPVDPSKSEEVAEKLERAGVSVY